MCRSKNAWNHEDSKGRVTKEELAAFKKQYQGLCVRATNFVSRAILCRAVFALLCRAGSQEEIDDIVKLYNDGSSLSEIAEQMWFGRKNHRHFDL